MVPRVEPPDLPPADTADPAGPDTSTGEVSGLVEETEEVEYVDASTGEPVGRSPGTPGLRSTGSTDTSEWSETSRYFNK